MLILRELYSERTPVCVLPRYRPQYWRENAGADAAGCSIWRARVRQERARLEAERQAELTLLPDTELVVRSGEPRMLKFEQ